MESLAIFAVLDARRGKENEVEAFLRSALPLAMAERETIGWYALRLGPSRFGIFDTFASSDGRRAHLSGEIARALFAQAEELFESPPVVEFADVIASKARAS